MNKHIIIVLLIVTKLFLVNAHAQSSVSDSLDATLKKQEIFVENFDNDHNHWLADTPEKNVAISIEKGLLHINNTRDTGWMEGVDIDTMIDYSRDFEIDLSLQLIGKYKRYKDLTGFYWGATDSWGAGCHWICIAPGRITFTYCHGGDHKQDEHKWLYYWPRFKKERFNKITIRKIQNTYSIYVNDKPIKTLPFEPLMVKGTLSFAACEHADVAYDYLKIYYLN